jgi:exodeoxyribonuclease V beta subunit
MNPTRPFDLTGALPRGRVVIEASAGTGKTYTLAGLVVRYVAEAGYRIDELLVVTFTRAAAAELRDRIRARLAEAVAALRNPLDAPFDDPLLVLLAEKETPTRLVRLERSLVDFDAATITTIHGFAQQVLATLGSSTSTNPDATLLEDSEELIHTVCADVLAAEALTEASYAATLPSLKDLVSMATRVLGNPGIRVVPDADDPSASLSASRLRVLLEKIIHEVGRRKSLAGTRSFDDLLVELRDALRDNPAISTGLLRRYPVALIDEFQDTDPVQWEFFSTLFDARSENFTLVLVGDPKQAIYAFRGANVHTYLAAAEAPGSDRVSLTVNWRSDKALLDSLGALLTDVTFGDSRIEFRPVEAAADHWDRRLTDADGKPLPALHIRCAVGSGMPRNTNGKDIPSEEARAIVFADLALQIQELLDTAWLPGGALCPERPLRPHDIAVLVGRNAEAEEVQAALRERHIPALFTRGTNVLASEAATQWRWLLHALTRPTDPSRARTAALSCFFGWSFPEIDTADEQALSDVQEQLVRWVEILTTQGAIDFCAHLWSDSGIVARVLQRPQGDRLLTDLEHIGSLLQTASSRRPTAASLLLSFEDLATQHSSDPEHDVTARRCESESEAVQIMTIHNAKGLEFPVVCAPSLWRPPPKGGKGLVFQDPLTNQRIFDITDKDGWATKERAAQHNALAQGETLGENLRLLYVALTRAAHQILVWWAPVQDNKRTALAHVLFARDAGTIDHSRFTGAEVTLPDDPAVLDALGEVFARVEDTVALQAMSPPDPSAAPWIDQSAIGLTHPLHLATLERILPRQTRRWSFSAISDRAATRNLDPSDDSLGDAGAADEPATDPHEESSRVLDVGTNLPLGAVRGGTQFGTLVHEVLQQVDFSSGDLNSEISRHVKDRLRWNPWPVNEVDLVAGLRAALETPLGPLFSGQRLCDLPLGDSLRELHFELRLGEHTRHPTDRDIGALVLHHLPLTDPLRPWAEQLTSGLFDVELGGHLTGSIDAIFRVGNPKDPAIPPRFVVADYKTNTLAEEGREPRSTDYHPARLATAMAEHHYPLQALLYAVALHRYLRWRLPDYTPARHLGGAAYLFVRGMTGANTPIVEGHPQGVFSWDIPPGLVTALSDLLDGQLVPT